jgi:signal transduction histidine kinase
MHVMDDIKSMEQAVEERSKVLFDEHKNKIYRETDRLFVGLMLFQWLAGILIALVVSPLTWLGSNHQIHIHVWAAVFLGGGIALFPILLGIFIPGHFLTRNVIAVAQMLFSALLIHLTGGRIETHFHVFGSLAFLAFYRDWKILVPATIVVALDHMLRGLFWPQSVFGVLTASSWRWVEHAAWVVFEDIFLISSCKRSVQEMERIAKSTAQLEVNNQIIEIKVKERTQELFMSRECLAAEITERRKLENMMIQSEKMAAVGQLAAGVAHEINNPVGFIGNNIEVLEQYTMDYSRIMAMVEQLKKSIKEGNLEEARVIIQKITDYENEINLNYVIMDSNKLLQDAQMGVERIRKIVLDLRAFAREDHNETEVVKVEEVIDSILSIVHNEIKYKAELKKSYGETAFVKCSTQRLGQVFINLFVNAVQSIREKGTIDVKTYMEGDFVCVDIADDGAGISADNLKRIFDPFFTTKPVGQGTGLGLSVSYEIIKKYNGEIRVCSELGKGTTFTVMIPAVKAS